MADDNDDWFGGEDDEPAPEIKPIKKGKDDEEAPAAEGAAAEAEGEAPAPGEGEAPTEAADEDYLDPDKLLLFKHWIRPKFLPYKYIYLYRKIYYDDVMDYLDKRNRGITRDLPHAETWAERIVRNCRNKIDYSRMFRKRIQADADLVERTKYSGHFFYYHNKQTFNRQFSPLLH